MQYALFINDITKYVITAFGGLNIAQSCYPSLNNSEDIVLLNYLYYCMLTTHLY